MAEHAQAYVELKHMKKIFDGYVAADDVSFSIKKGKLTGLLGPSGSGKTTVLRMIAGLESADSGEIYIDGKQISQIPAGQRGIGFVFQNYALFRHKTVFDNIAFGLKIQRLKKEEIQNRVHELMELTGLSELGNRYPKQLSGGQRQRVAFARAIAVRPQLLLLDEPFAAIDAKVRKELREWLRELISQVGITSIFVTHDQDEAVEVADEIIIMNHGRIEQIGSPVDVYNHPETPFVVQFLGNPVSIKNYTHLKGFPKTSENTAAMIRPEFITVWKKNEFNPCLTSAEDGIVERTVFRGNAIELTIRVHGERLTACRQLGQEMIHEGEHVNLFLQKLYFIDEKTNHVEVVMNELGTGYF